MSRPLGSGRASAWWARLLCEGLEGRADRPSLVGLQPLGTVGDVTMPLPPGHPALPPSTASAVILASVSATAAWGRLKGAARDPFKPGAPHPSEYRGLPDVLGRSGLSLCIAG